MTLESAAPERGSFAYRAAVKRPAHARRSRPLPDRHSPRLRTLPARGARQAAGVHAGAAVLLALIHRRRSRRRSIPRPFRQFWRFHQLFRSYGDARRRRQGLDRPGRMVLGLQAVGGLIGETILIAYVGTLTGAMLAFGLNFSLRRITGRRGSCSRRAVCWNSAGPSRISFSP